MNRSLQAYRPKQSQKSKVMKQSKATLISQTPIKIAELGQTSNSRKKHIVQMDLGQDPNIVIQNLFRMQKQAQQTGKYVQAEAYKRKIQNYKQQIQKYQYNYIMKKHDDERVQIQAAHEKQMNLFNQKWDKILDEILNQVQMVEKDLIQRQQIQLKQAMEKEGQQSIDRQGKFRQSSQLLNLKKIQQELAKQQNYLQAHQVQSRVQKLQKIQYQKWKRQQHFKQKNTFTNLRSKHQTQLNAMKQRIQISLEQKNKQRKYQHQQLILKYQNVMKELEYQQNQQLQKFNKKVQLAQIDKKHKASFGNQSMISKSRMSIK